MASRSSLCSLPAAFHPFPVGPGARKKSFAHNQTGAMTANCSNMLFSTARISTKRVVCITTVGVSAHAACGRQLQGLHNFGTARGKNLQRGMRTRQYCPSMQVMASGNGSGEYDYDLFTIGAGSGGVRATRFSATNYGAKTAICELPFARIASDEAGGAGGTCVLRGCVPKKLMVYGGEFSEAFRDSKAFGWDAEQPGLTWQRMNDNKNKELDRLNGVYMKLLNSAGVDYLEGFGKVVDPNTVEARNILVATGAKATKLPIEGAEHAIISDHVLDLPERPKKMAIIGGGYIAVEFAGIFNNYGTEVHLAFRQPQPLRGFDEECRQFITEQYEQRGLNLHPDTTPERIEKKSDGTLTLHLKQKSGESAVLEGLDQVLMATGRRPNTGKLGLKDVGVKLHEKSGAVIVDEQSRTNLPSIWAVGDVTDRIALTPVALMEGMAFARNAFGGDSSAAPDYEAIASAVFSSPPLASVGLTEEEAKEKYKNLDLFTSSFRPMKNTVSGNEGRGFMKIIVDADSDRVVGMHMIGPDCAEIMQGFAVAVKMGVKKSQMDTVVGIHPSSAEEFVTMRSPSRQIRDRQPVESK